MNFSDKYTTAEKITKDISPEKMEKNKITLSNDAFSIGELLECYINKMVR